MQAFEMACMKCIFLVVVVVIFALQIGGEECAVQPIERTELDCLVLVSRCIVCFYAAAFAKNDFTQISYGIVERLMSFPPTFIQCTEYNVCF